MVRGEVHSLAKIEAMGFEALHTRIEFELGATVGTGLVVEPVQQGAAMTFGAMGSIGDEIIHVEISSGEELVVKAVAGDGPNRAVRFEGGKVKALRLHPAHAGDELRFDQMRPELGHHGEATGDGLIGGGEGNVHGSLVIKSAGDWGRMRLGS